MTSSKHTDNKGKKILSAIFPSTLWTRRFLVGWSGSFISILVFDVLWCSITNFGALSFVNTYICCLAVAMLLALPSLISAKRWPQLVVLLLFDMLCIANLMYARTYYEMIPASSYFLAGNVAEFTDSIIASLRWWDISFPVIAIITFWLMPEKKTSFPYKSYFATLLALILVGMAFVLPYGGLSKHIEWLKNSAYGHASPPVVYTLPVALIDDIFQGMSSISQDDIDSAEEIIKKRGHLADMYETKYPSDSMRRDNLVMIIIESLEAWPIGQSVQGQELTPNINRWLEDSTTWFARRVASQVGTGRSIDGQLLMTTGLYPTSRCVYSMEYHNSTYPSLAQEIRNINGANTYLMTGDRKTTWNQVLMAQAFGLDSKRFRDDWDNSEYFGHHRNPTDKSLYRQISEKMREGEIWPEGEKAVVQIVTFSSHHPWKINPEARVVKIDRESEPIHPLLAQYIEAVSYVDDALAVLIDYLKSRDDWERTMVVIVGDHEGLATQRKEMREDSPGVKDIVDDHEYVPMIVLNSPIGGRRNEVMGQIDVYPTVLDLMGITPQWPGLGFSAFSPLSPNYAAAPVSQPGIFPVVTDSLALQVQEIVKSQPRTGNTIIAADLLNSRLPYSHIQVQSPDTP